MEIKGKIWLMFEQSATFKNEFKKLGYEAFDLDIQNNFGETDYQIDLFEQIKIAYGGGKSIFDNITKDDLVMAFFPCIYFCNRSLRGDYFNKPTQYWFVNCTNTQGFTQQPPKKHKRVASGHPGVEAGICSEDRSLISPDYSRNFICDFILGKAQPEINPTLFDAI